MRKGNIIAGLICGALAVYIIITCMGYPTAESYGTGVPGPGLWPGIVALLLLICSIGLIAGTLMMKKEELPELPMLTEGTKRVYATMIILIVYVASLSVLGFIIPSIAMLLVFIQWFGKMKIWKTVIISVAAALVVYFVFKNLLNVPVDFGMFYL